MMVFREENILFNLNIPTKEEAIKAIVEKMVENGSVNREYFSDVMNRENKYPTGLPTVPIGIAIPHANSGHVLQSDVGLVFLEKSVKFTNMATMQSRYR